ncbi:MAG: N-acetyltransferase family protein [Bacteroidia bacterium]
MNFRNALQKDLARIVEIYNSTIPSRMVTADTEPVSVESKQAWFEKHSPDKFPLWVMENDNEIVGWISLQPLKERCAYYTTTEIGIYIDEHHRGKGLGKKALQHSIQNAPKVGITILVGYIFAHNTPSIELFKHFDFEEWGNLPNVAVLDGQKRSVKIFGKQIAE